MSLSSRRAILFAAGASAGSIMAPAVAAASNNVGPSQTFDGADDVEAVEAVEDMGNDEGGEGDGGDDEAHQDETFSSLVFEDTFDTGSDFDPGRWSELVVSTSPYRHVESTSYLNYEWGVINVEAHDVADGRGRLWWRLRRNPDGSLNPVTGWQNLTDDKRGVETLRYYDDAYITTEDTHGQGALKGFVYGRVEGSIRFPQDVAGLWGCFWLHPDNHSVGGEIDIAEAYGGGNDTGDVGATVHFSQVNSKDMKTQYVLPRPDLTGYHTYAVEKTPKRITFYFDGQRFHEVLRQDNVAIFDENFGPGITYHIRLNTQTGCTWRNSNPDPDVFEQATMDVDYIRVWAMD